MRIGVVGPVGPDQFADNIYDSLIRMGHDAVALGSARGWTRLTPLGRLTRIIRDASPGLDGRLQRSILGRALDSECDVVINTEVTLSPEIVSILTDRGVPVALWFPDHAVTFGRALMLAAPYTAWFFKDPVMVSRLRDTLGLPAWYLPEACNPHWHRPIGEPASLRHIAVVGTLYVSRLLLVRRLHEAGIPLLLHGPAVAPWARRLLPPELELAPPIVRDEKSAVFRTAVGVLNNLHLGEASGVNCRLFEATAAGAAVLCERRPALADLYDIDREVLAYDNFAELVDHAKALLGQPRLAADLGDAAAKRAHADHTYDLRLSRILELIV